MRTEDLFRHGQEAEQRGDHFGALQYFLSLREQQIDLVRVWQLGGPVPRIRLRDLDANGYMEVGALSAAGEFEVYTLQPLADQPVRHTGNKWRNFRLFPYIDETPAVVLVGDDNVLSVYTFTKRGAALSFVHEKDVMPPQEIGEIVDVAYKRRRIYVVGTEPKICEYSALTFGPPRLHNFSLRVRRLNSGGRSADDPLSVMNRHMLGLLRDGGLGIFDLDLGAVKEGRRVAGTERYLDAFVGDPDNDGTDDIIAISQDGKLHIYNWFSLQLRYAITWPDEF